MLDDDTVAFAEERAVLGGLFAASPPYPSEVRMLEPEYFQQKWNAKIFLAAQDLLREGVAELDMVSVIARLRDYGLYEKGMASHLCGLIDESPFSANLDHWCSVLIDAGRKREIKRRVEDAVARAGDDADLGEIQASVQDAIRSVSKLTSSTGLVHVREPLRAVIEEIVAGVGTEELVIARTGIRALDDLAKLLPGQLTVIAGRPGMGKSALAGTIAAHCARERAKGAVALFSLEMTSIECVKRVMAVTAGASFDKLVKTGNAAVVEKIREMELYIDDRPGISVSQMADALRSLSDVRLVIVDYLQLAHTDGKLERQDLRVGANTKALKALAKEFRCLVIAMSQLSRSCESRNPPRPTMADMRDSGNIEEDADNVWLLYREAYYRSDAPPALAEVIVAKQRHGRTGCVNVCWSPELTKFSDIGAA